jgi:hypothetical protein
MGRPDLTRRSGLCLRGRRILTAHQALEINGAQCRSGVISHCQAKDCFNHGRYGLASQYPNTVVMAVAFASILNKWHIYIAGGLPEQFRGIQI